MIRFGASLVRPDEAEFLLWAPQAGSVELLLGARALPMQRGQNGFFVLRTTAAAGERYRYRIDGGQAVPDPASRAQAEDVHGPSLIVDQAFDWGSEDWRGRPWEETIVYEAHAGLFGGFAGLEAELPRLKKLGLTALQLMPIADFPGRHNWGYDGVLPYAPASAYGTPDELKRLVDAAHRHGLQIFLDVVYNHFGPDGNYLHLYAKDFFDPKQKTPWGDAIDFSRPQVRDFFIGNALYWLDTYRFDGLRFDAVHAIADEKFLLEMARTIRATLPDRHIHLILENEHNDATLLNGAKTDQKYDAQWADDFHHCVHVLLTGENEAYYEDFFDPAAQLARCLREGFAYQGEPSCHAGGKPRGSQSAHLPPTAFVICLQNHDQVGNRAFGERLRSLADPRALAAAICLHLLTPQIPMIFFGEEYGETRPFLFFTDHHEELGKLVTQGRRQEFARFAAFSDPGIREKIPDPNDPATFAASRPHVAANEWTALYETCLSLRHAQIVPRLAGARALDARVRGRAAILARWRMGDGAILTLAANLDSAPVPCEPVSGTLWHGPGVSERMLPGFSACLWIETP